MRIFILVAICFLSTVSYAQVQTISDDFEGNGTILSWYGGDCGMDNHYVNPYPSGINPSATVLKYADVGALYAHIIPPCVNNKFMQLTKEYLIL